MQTLADPVPDAKRLGAGKCRVLLVVGHPRKGSFCEALANSYLAGLPENAETRVLHLAELDFNPDVQFPSPTSQRLEPDLVAAQEAILWADHLVLIFPTWWGTMPARLKGFLDRALTPGFAFREKRGRYQPLLRGRTGHVITTMDTPPFLYRAFFGSPGTRAMALSTLWFCGIKPSKITRIGPVKGSAPERRERWLRQVRREAERLPEWLARKKRFAQVLSWLKIARLQFYGMTMLAYGLGAAMAFALSNPTREHMDWPVFWLGFAALFLVEFASVLTNEIHDLPTDRENTQFGPFTGGSRVLVQEELSVQSVRSVRNIALMAATVCAGLAAAQLPASALLPAGTLFGLGLILGLGYTAPPLRLAWRGLGELDVAVTHSIYMVLCGWVLQEGSPAADVPWIVSAPMALAIFASILLAGIPDHDADRAVGKNTLVVKLGTQGAAVLASLTTFAAGTTGAVLFAATGARLGSVLPILFLCHTAALLFRLSLYRVRREDCSRIDGLLFLALTYILWFSVVPLLIFLR